MLRKAFNLLVCSRLLEEYPQYAKIIFLDTETTVTTKQTAYGLEWYPEIISLQMAIWNGATLEKVLVSGGDILPNLRMLASCSSDTLLVGYNILYDLYAIYRNLYMEFPQNEYKSVNPFLAHVLDLMLSYDLSIVTCLGKRDDHRECFEPLLSIKRIPRYMYKGAYIADELSQLIKEELLPKFGEYCEIECYPKRRIDGEEWDDIFLKIAAKKSLKAVMSILGEKTDTLDEIGMKNIELDEFSFICPEDKVKEIAQNRAHNLELLQDERFWVYAERDIDYLIHLLYALNYPRPHIFHKEVAVQAYLRYVGIPVHYDKTVEQIANIDKEVSETQKRVDEIMGKAVNLNSVPQKKALLFKITGETPPNTTKETIQKLSKKHDNAILRALARNGQHAYTRRMLENIERMGKSGLHPDELLSITTTYRKAHIGKFPSVGIPRNQDIRSLFHISACGDQHGAEIVIWQRYVSDPLLGEDLKAGIDIHCKVLATCIKKDYQEVYAAYKAGDPSVIEHRGLIKRVTFAAFYGGTESGIAEINNIPVAVVTTVLDAFTDNYPKFKQYRDMTSEFHNMAEIATDWSQCGALLRSLPVSVVNVFNLKVYAAVEKTIEIVLSDICNIAENIWRGDAPKFKRKDRPQTISGCVRSALLGGIGRLQGQVQRRLMNNPIQSSVSVVTKLAKGFLFDKYGIPSHDVHDELLIPYGFHVPDIQGKFKVFEQKIKEVFPYLSWDLVETEIWKK